MKHFEGASFDTDVLGAPGAVVVDFYADWCGPCRMMSPVLDKLAQEFDGRLTIGKLDVDESPEISIRYGVMGIPTLGVFEHGQLVDRLVGYPGGAEPIRQWLEKHAGVPQEQTTKPLS